MIFKYVLFVWKTLKILILLGEFALDIVIWILIYNYKYYFSIIKRPLSTVYSLLITNDLMSILCFIYNHHLSFILLVVSESVPALAGWKGVFRIPAKWKNQWMKIVYLSVFFYEMPLDYLLKTKCNFLYCWYFYPRI